MQYTEEQITRANQTNLVSFLNAQGEQLVKSGREYRWKKHDSVTVSGNRWYRHSQGRGGYPVDFVMEFYNATFPEAVKKLIGEEGEGRNSTCPAPSPDFRLPEKEENNEKIIRYLTENRGIEKNLVEEWISSGDIYEEKKHHNVVFVGRDADGIPRYAHCRGTSEIKYRGDVAGSDKSCGFCHRGTDNQLFVFEAAIDLLSFIQLFPKDHHAIIPTMESAKADLAALPETERKILSLVANRLLCATGEKHLYETVKAELSCGGYTFTTSGKSVLKNGWKDFEDAFKRSFKTMEDKEKEDKKLPELSEGQTFDGVHTKISEHYTNPPKHFTEDSLLSAMERAGSEDMGDDVERKGLGTPATRADIIEKLVKDGFVKREKKLMIPTEDGMKLITVLPDVVKSPKLTADWENALTLVAKGEYSMQEFMDGIADMVKNLVQTYHSISDEQKSMFGGNQSAQEALGKCPKCGGDVVKGKYGAYCKNKCGMNVGKSQI